MAFINTGTDRLNVQAPAATFPIVQPRPLQYLDPNLFVNDQGTPGLLKGLEVGGQLGKNAVEAANLAISASTSLQKAPLEMEKLKVENAEGRARVPGIDAQTKLATQQAKAAELDNMITEPLVNDMVDFRKTDLQNRAQAGSLANIQTEGFIKNQPNVAAQTQAQTNETIANTNLSNLKGQDMNLQLGIDRNVLGGLTQDSTPTLSNVPTTPQNQTLPLQGLTPNGAPASAYQYKQYGADRLGYGQGDKDYEAQQMKDGYVPGMIKINLRGREMELPGWKRISPYGDMSASPTQDKLTAPVNRANELGVPAVIDNPYYRHNPVNAEKERTTDDANDRKAMDAINLEANKARASTDAVHQFLNYNNTLTTGRVLGRNPISDDVQNMQQIASKGVYGNLPKGMGKITNTEIGGLSKGFLSPTNNPTVNEDIAKRVIAGNQLVQDEAQFFKAYKDAHQTLYGADSAWQQYMRDNPIVDAKGNLIEKRMTAKDYFTGINSGQKPQVNAGIDNQTIADTLAKEGIRPGTTQAKARIKELLGK